MTLIDMVFRPSLLTMGIVILGTLAVGVTVRKINRNSGTEPLLALIIMGYFIIYLLSHYTVGDEVSEFKENVHYVVTNIEDSELNYEVRVRESLYHTPIPFLTIDKTLKELNKESNVKYIKELNLINDLLWRLVYIDHNGTYIPLKETTIPLSGDKLLVKGEGITGIDKSKTISKYSKVSKNKVSGKVRIDLSSTGVEVNPLTIESVKTELKTTERPICLIEALRSSYLLHIEGNPFEDKSMYADTIKILKTTYEEYPFNIYYGGNYITSQEILEELGANNLEEGTNYD